MEVFYWYIGNVDGEPIDIAGPSLGIELPQFLVDVQGFMGPLFLLLAIRAGKGLTESPPVFDKRVYADPKLDDCHKWDGKDLLEIKRANPEFIRLLSEIPADDTTALAKDWHASPNVVAQVASWEGRDMTEAEQRLELAQLVTGLSALSKRALTMGKDIMQKFWWATS